MINAVKGFGIVNKAEIDVFLELSCFFNDPVDVANLISEAAMAHKSRRLRWCTIAAQRSYPMSEVRGSSWEELPHVQRAMAVQAQVGLEELFHVQYQEGWQ